MRRKFQKFKEENVISFLNRREMIQFVSKYFTVQYKRFLEQEYFIQTESEEEKAYREIEISSCISRFEKALKIILHVYLMFNKNFEITNESNILRLAFDYVGENISPRACFEESVKYKIRNLTFKKVHD